MKTIVKYLFGIILLLLVGYILFLFVQNREKQKVISSTTVSVISQLKSVKILETAQMTITKIVEGEKQQSSSILSIVPMSSDIMDKIQKTFFEDKIILQVEGVVTAGFDMSKLDSGSVEVYADNSVSITLPPAEILHVKLTENTKPYDRKLGIFTKGDTELETDIRNQALEIIRQDAINAGIIQQAEISAMQTLKEFLQSMNVNVIEVKIRENLNL